MHLPGKPLLLLMAVLTAFILTADAAPAQDVEVFPEQPAGDECGNVALAGHATIEGCHIELEGNMALYAHMPSEMPIMNCHWDVEARLGQGGEGYVVRATLTSVETEGAPIGCTREPCDEVAAVGAHRMRPWPVHLVEAAPGDRRFEVTLCFRSADDPEGIAGWQCQVHLELSTLAGTHNYRAGHDGQHAFCEVSPEPFPVSVEGSLVMGAGSAERIELVHPAL